MNSIRSFFVNSNTFNYNYAQAKVATGYYKEAEELLIQINDPDIREQQSFNMVSAKCHILCGHAEQVWIIDMDIDVLTNLQNLFVHF